MRDILVVENKYARKPRGTHKMLRQFIAERAPAYGFTLGQIVARDRSTRVAAARQALMAEAYATGQWGVLRLGRGFERDHTTVLHAINKMRAMAEREAA